MAAHIVGRRIQEMIAAFAKGDLANATKINSEIAPLNRCLFMNTSPIMVKAACNLLGFKVGSLRLPLVEANATEITLLQEILKNLGLL